VLLLSESGLLPNNTLYTSEVVLAAKERSVLLRSLVERLPNPSMYSPFSGKSATELLLAYLDTLSIFQMF
jgi:hypothetical protein